MTVKLERVSRSLPSHFSLENINLSITAASGVGLLGRSGSGKTTLLRLIAGLDRVDSGQILINERIVSSPSVHVTPQERCVGLVFQDLALWPHLTALEHLLLVAEPLGISRHERRSRADGWLQRLQINKLSRRRPDQMSGGERQRLALARALLREPRALLLDEPFTGLDRPLLLELKDLVGNLTRDLKIPLVVVSHDWEHITGLVERAAVLDAGRIVCEAPVSDIPKALATTPHAALIPPGASPARG